MLFLILKNIYLISGNHLATPPNCLTTPTLGTTDLNNIKMYTVDKQYKNRRHIGLNA